MEEERARLVAMVKKYYPDENDKRALCMANRTPFLILIAIFNGKNPETVFDLNSEVRREIYDFSLMELEVYGYVEIESDGRPLITSDGKKFMEDIKKRR